jgi:hypothetical protein
MDAPLAAFAAADDKKAPPPNGVLFVGSSSIRLWDGLDTDFAALPVVINRGFGGSRLSDCVHYLDRLVIRYRPRMVLVYAGDNDLAEGRTAADVLRQFEAFVQGIHWPARNPDRASFRSSRARRALRCCRRSGRANALVRATPPASLGLPTSMSIRPCWPPTEAREASFSGSARFT